MSNKLRGGIAPGGVDLSLAIILHDSTTGATKTGVAFGSVTAYYYRQGAASAVQITTASLGSASAAHSDGGWFEIDATNTPGLYRFDVTDAFWATGSDWVSLNIRVSGADDVNLMFALDPFVVDSNGRVQVQYGTSTGQVSATSGVLAVNLTQCGGSTVAAGAIPNAAAAASGGLPTVDANNSVKLRSGTGTNEISLASGLVSVGTMGSNSVTSSTLAASALSAITAAFWLSSPASETYAADGAIPNLGQFLLMIMQRQNEWDKSSLTITMKKLDGTTTAATFTLSGTPTDPTGITRTS